MHDPGVILVEQFFCLVAMCPANTPAKMRHLPNAGLMLDHRLRRWPNIKPALCNLYQYREKAACLLCGNLPSKPRR